MLGVPMNFSAALLFFCFFSYINRVWRQHGSVYLSVYLCAFIRTFVCTCAEGILNVGYKPWRTRRRRRARRRWRAKKSNYSTPIYEERRGWEHCWDFCSSTRLSERRDTSNGNSIFSEEILDVRETCSLEIQHPQRASNLQFLHVFLPLLSVTKCRLSRIHALKKLA